MRRVCGATLLLACAAMAVRLFAARAEWLAARSSSTVGGTTPSTPIVAATRASVHRTAAGTTSTGSWQEEPKALPVTSSSSPAARSPLLGKNIGRGARQAARSVAAPYARWANATLLATDTYPNASVGERNGGSCLPRRLLHWNILDGGGSRRDGICKFIRDGQYDVVTMNELNGFDDAKLSKFGERCGRLLHSQLLAKSAYRLGILSRHPLELLKADRSGTFAHGLLCVKVLRVKLCLTHLNPHDARRRVTEARAIVRHVRRNERFMLVGDLNTLSSLDSEAHAQASLPSKIKQGPYARQLSRKFLNRSGDGVDYSPMKVLLDARLHDVGASGGYSVPTSINADHMHFATLRLDYCLVNEPLLQSCGARERPRLTASVLRNQRADTLSDHFPLEVRFDAPRDKIDPAPAAPSPNPHQVV